MFYFFHMATPSIDFFAFSVHGKTSIISVRSMCGTSIGNLQFSGLDVPSWLSWLKLAAPSQYHILRAYNTLPVLFVTLPIQPANTPAEYVRTIEYCIPFLFGTLLFCCFTLSFLTYFIPSTSISLIFSTS